MLIAEKKESSTKELCSIYDVFEGPVLLSSKHFTRRKDGTQDHKDQRVEDDGVVYKEECIPVKWSQRLFRQVKELQRCNVFVRCSIESVPASMSFGIKSQFVSSVSSSSSSSSSSSASTSPSSSSIVLIQAMDIQQKWCVFFPHAVDSRLHSSNRVLSSTGIVIHPSEWYRVLEQSATNHCSGVLIHHIEHSHSYQINQIAIRCHDKASFVPSSDYSVPAAFDSKLSFFYPEEVKRFFNDPCYIADRVRIQFRAEDQSVSFTADSEHGEMEFVFYPKLVSSSSSSTSSQDTWTSTSSSSTLSTWKWGDRVSTTTKNSMYSSAPVSLTILHFLTSKLCPDFVQLDMYMNQTPQRKLTLVFHMGPGLHPVIAHLW